MSAPRPLGVRRAKVNEERFVQRLTRLYNAAASVTWNPDYLWGLGAPLAAALAPPKQGARPGWPRPCFVYSRPLGEIPIPGFSLIRVRPASGHGLTQ